MGPSGESSLPEGGLGNSQHTSQLISHYEARIILVPKAKVPQENYRPLFLMHIDAKFILKYQQNECSNKEKGYEDVSFILGI